MWFKIFVIYHIEHFYEIEITLLKTRYWEMCHVFLLPCCSLCMAENSICRVTSLSICKFPLKTCLSCNAKSLTVRQLSCCNCCFSLPTRLPLMCFLHLLLVTIFGPLVIDHRSVCLHIKFSVELWFLNQCLAVSYPGRNTGTDFKAICKTVTEMHAALKTGTLLLIKVYVKRCTPDPLI